MLDILSLNENAVYYFFSTTAQSVAAMVALGASMAILRLSVMYGQDEDHEKKAWIKTLNVMNYYLVNAKALNSEAKSGGRVHQRDWLTYLRELVVAADRSEAGRLRQLYKRELEDGPVEWKEVSDRFHEALNIYFGWIQQREDFKAKVLQTTRWALGIILPSMILTTSPAWKLPGWAYWGIQVVFVLALIRFMVLLYQLAKASLDH